MTSSQAHIHAHTEWEHSGYATSSLSPRRYRWTQTPWDASLPKYCPSLRLTFLLTNWKAEHFLKEKADFSRPPPIPPPPPPPPFTSFMADTGAPLASLDPRVTDRLASRGKTCLKHQGEKKTQTENRVQSCTLQKEDAGEWVHEEVEEGPKTEGVR